MHFCSPCDAITGCHSMPFSCTPIAVLQPPFSIMTCGDLMVPNREPWSPNSFALFKFFSLPGFISGHFLQHAFLSGRYATFSEQFKGGHCVRGHWISNVTMLQVQTAQVSKPFGGKYGCQKVPAKWNWSPNWQPRVEALCLSDITESERGKRKWISWDPSTEI